MWWYFEKFFWVYDIRLLNVKTGSWTTADRLVPRKWPTQVTSKSCECLWRTKKTSRVKVCLQNQILIKRLRKTKIPKIHFDLFIHGNSEIRGRSFDSNPPRTISFYPFGVRLQCGNVSAVSIIYYITGSSSSTPVNGGHWLDYGRPSRSLWRGVVERDPPMKPLMRPKGFRLDPGGFVVIYKRTRHEPRRPFCQTACGHTCTLNDTTVDIRKTVPNKEKINVTDMVF